MRTVSTLRAVWGRLSERERKLALAVLVLFALMASFTLVRRSLDTVLELDKRIAQMQDDILNYHRLIAKKQSVEAHYAEVATQHSSEWTEPEIQERLRQEIYRLAQITPPPLNEDGVPVRTNNPEGNLVEIPSLGQGVLREGGEGFREYTITFKVPPVEFAAMVEFLERLQGSPQSLRIDGLELIRHFSSTQVGATISITRTIVNRGADEDSAGAGVEQ